MSGQAIKSMKLYSRVERVYAQLRDAGIPEDGPVPLDVLSRFDQYHYDGVAAVEEGIARLGLAPHHRALDVGSGLGGPARIIADRAGCAVTALELQPDVHEVAARLTARAGLTDLVSHRQGDILEGAPGGFDALFAWLVFLHIPDRGRLYRRCFEALRPGGAMYVEDYFERGMLTDAERGTLICIDDVELDMHAFGRMLGVYAGFGMRIAFVDEDDVANAPEIMVKEPEDEAPDMP